MSDLTTILFFLTMTVILFTYPAIGLYFVSRFRPGIIARAKVREGTKFKSGGVEKVAYHTHINRQQVTDETKQLLFGWPYYAWDIYLDNRNKEIVDRCDPFVYVQMQQDIAKLEDEAEKHRIRELLLSLEAK